MAKVIPLRPEPAKEVPAAQRAPLLSVSQAFIQMLGVFQARRDVLIRWLGARAYQAAAKSRRKSSRFRKGAMLDQKAE